jgi:hypothetical protein
MAGKKSQLECLEARRKILIAESDLHRIQLQQEWIVLKEEIQHVVQPLKRFGDFASSAAKAGTMAAKAGAVVAVAGKLWSLRRNHHHNGSAEPGSFAKTSPLMTAFRGLRTGISLWVTLRSVFRR